MPVLAQSPPAPRTILAIGAHAGDMELTTGALLIKQHKAGDRIVILHMTLGEGGNPKMSPALYGAQKRREALAADSAIGAETIFAPYKDGELPNDEAVRLYEEGLRSYSPAGVYVKDIFVCPMPYFFPYSFDEAFHESCITPETYGVHFWEKSWEKDLPGWIRLAKSVRAHARRLSSQAA